MGRGGAPAERATNTVGAQSGSTEVKTLQLKEGEKESFRQQEIASKPTDETTNTLRTPEDGASGGSSTHESERAKEPYPADTGAAKKKLDYALRGGFPGPRPLQDGSLP